MGKRGTSPVDERQRDKLLECLADGQSLRAICREPDMPALSTVMKYIGENPSFAEHYGRARAAGTDAMAEDIQDIADDATLDPNDRRIRIDARKWLLAKRQPKKYGDKVEFDGKIEHGISAETARALIEKAAKG